MAFAVAAVCGLILFPGASPAATGPTAVLTSSPTPATGKAPLTVSFDATGSSDSDGNIVSWTLDFGDGHSDSGGSVLPSADGHTYTTAGDYTATLTITDDQSATSQATVDVTAQANVPPTAVLTSAPTPATGKAPLKVTFNASASSDSDGSIASWKLDFGDGSSDSGGSVLPSADSHTYTVGNYTATLTVTDDQGATDQATVAVTAKANVAPTAVLTSSPTPATGKAPLSVTFNGSASSDSDGSIASWTLDFGDNSTQAAGSGSPPSSLPHTYSAGTYTAVLTVKDDNGATGTDSIAVDANAPPTASLTADKTSGPTPLAVTFNGSGSKDSDGSIASWTMNFGDGTSTGPTAGPVPSSIPHTYTGACSCTASLTVTDNQGAQSTPATVAMNVTTNQPPVASLSVTPTSGTVPLGVSFDGSGSSDPDGIQLKSWSLDFGDLSAKATGTGAVPNAIAHTYNTAGTYHAVLTVTDSSNALTSSTPVTITVNQQPSITIGDVSQNEGNSGTTNFVFPVTLSSVSTHDVTVDYKTSDGTAIAGSDYTATSGTLKIPAGTDCTTSNPACTITVPVTGDTIYETNETFTLTLSNPTAATIADGTATGTILNDDQPPLVLIENGSTLEGNAGSKVSNPGAQSWNSGGNLQLDNASGFPLSLAARTFYISTPGSPTISAQYTYAGINGNTLTGVKPAGTIAANQIAFHPNTLSVGVLLCDPQKTNPPNDPGACVPITSGLTTTVQYQTADGRSLTTAIPVVEGQDYVESDGTLTIPAGQNSGKLTFQTIPNTTPENPIPGDDLTRWFNVHLSSPTNATIGWGLGTALIIDDDAPNPPSSTTGAASAIGTDHATVSATVNPKGSATTVYVRYGPTDSYGSQTASKSLAAGSSDQSLSFSLTGLSPATTYHYQVVATHSDMGTGYGQDSTFKTDVPPTAVLKADKTSGPVPLPVTFDGSGSTDPDGSIKSWTLSFGDGTTPAAGTGLVPSAIPHTYASPCSCSASLTVTDNQGGQSKAATVTIKVGPTKAGPPPKLSTYTTTLGPTGAKIVFPVDPNGAQTRVWVEYGATSSYGQMSGVQTISAGSVQTMTVPLTGLSPATAYHFAIYAAHTTDTGATHSQDITFKTQPVRSMTVKLKARSVRATTRGTVSLPVACGGNVLGACTGRAVLRLGSLPAGSVSFSVRPGQQKRVTVRLKKTVLKRLLASSSLQLVLNLSVQTGTHGMHRTTAHVTILPPRK